MYVRLPRRDDDTSLGDKATDKRLLVFFLLRFTDSYLERSIRWLRGISICSRSLLRSNSVAMGKRVKYRNEGRATATVLLLTHLSDALWEE